MAESPPNACATCGKQEQALKRCASCLQTAYCSKECQASHWPKHKGDCKKVKLFDVYKSAPVLALCNWLAHNRIFNPALFGKVTRKQQIGKELHLYLSQVRHGGVPHRVFDNTGGRFSGELLRNMVTMDGPAAAMMVGMMVGFHVALFKYHEDHAGERQVKLVYKGHTITNYSICIGSHAADHELVYHYDGQTFKYSDHQQHCWVLFGSDSRDELALDVCAFAHGLLFQTDALPYAPQKGAAAGAVQMAAQGSSHLWVPLFVVDRQQVLQLDQQLMELGAQQRLFDTMYVERRRVNISGRKVECVDDLLEEVLAELLQVPVSAFTGDQVRRIHNWYADAFEVISEMLESGRFLKFPGTVQQAICTDALDPEIIADVRAMNLSGS